MLEVFRVSDPTEPIWSWYPPDQTAGFWFRRMAHETLIHRVDTENAHGPITTVDPEIANDGISEALAVFITGYPRWAEFEPTEDLLRLETSISSWNIRLGSYSGTTRSGRELAGVPAVVGDDSGDQPKVTISGEPGPLNLWLWGRGSLTSLSVSGEANLADRFRTIAAASM